MMISLSQIFGADTSWALLWVAAVSVLGARGVQGGKGGGCRSVHGRIVSALVESFPDGTMCDSPIGLCTVGTFSGDLAGDFRFTATGFVGYETIDPSAPLDMAATTGTITLTPSENEDGDSFCAGTLDSFDTSAFSFSPDGNFAGVHTLVGTSTGDCAGATGRIRVDGIFLGGCVDCDYAGEVCLGDGGSDEDEDEDEQN